MLLHIVNKSPFERDALTSCLRHAQAGASVLLIEDGVYAAQAGTTFSAHMTEALAQLAVYALAPDVEARGLQQKMLKGVTLVGYDGFVDLVAHHRASVSWL